MFPVHLECGHPPPLAQQVQDCEQHRVGNSDHRYPSHLHILLEAVEGVDPGAGLKVAALRHGLKNLDKGDDHKHSLQGHHGVFVLDIGVPIEDNKGRQPEKGDSFIDWDKGLDQLASIVEGMFDLYIEMRISNVRKALEFLNKLR